MKRSERIALGSLSTGIAAGFGLAYYTEDVFNVWVYVIVGAVVAGMIYQNFLRMIADESIIDSRTINRK